jgi:uncharacterized tellurite resistance protein B-like protein
MENMLIVRMWAAAAWADGKMHPAEAAALRRLIEASHGLDKEEALLLLNSADVDINEVKQLPTDARVGVYRAAMRLVEIDGEVTDEERAFIARLRTVIDLDEATLRRIESEPR